MKTEELVIDMNNLYVQGLIKVINDFMLEEASGCIFTEDRLKSNIEKLKAALKVKIVEFYFKKTDGTLRQAFGTLKENLIGEIKGTGRKPNDNLQVYWDTEKEEYRCFKKCNLIKIA